MLSALRRTLQNRTPWFVANFDSSAGLAKALGNCLHGEGFAGAGKAPNSELAARVVNALPWQLQRFIYVKGSAVEAIRPDKLGDVQAEEFARWVTGLYPKKQYPAILIGSAGGATVHLAAAMGIPWLPQTFLIPVQNAEHLSVDEPIQRMEWAGKVAKPLLDNNPQLQLHHMMDPNQDRPMLEAISYFRSKILQLGPAYEAFLREHLAPDGVIFVVECGKPWPTTRVDSRHYFQFGGLGGNSWEEYAHGGPRVAEFLERSGSRYKQWQAPTPDGERPESEWGFAPQLGEDIARFARQHGFRVQRVVYREPEDASPFVADLHRWWYRQRGMAADRLLMGMFFLFEPYWTLRTGSVPFWLAFNAQPSLDFVGDYLQKSEPYGEIYLMPFSHGVKGIGLASVAQMKSVLALAGQKGEFIGAQPELYPFDFGVFSRYQKDLKKKIADRYPMDYKLSLDQLYQFIHQAKGKYQVNWPGEQKTA